MSAAAVEQSGRANRLIQLTIDGPGEEILDAIAEAVAGGNRSAAMRYLLNVYAGREFAEQATRVFEVDQWRKPRLSRDLISRIAGLVYSGNIRQHAYALAGVSGRQASQWLAQGRADVAAGKESLYADLVMGLDKAEAEMVSEQVAEARRKGDYKFLLGRFPDYAKRTVSDATVTHQFTPLGDWELLTITEARTLVAILRKMSPSSDDPAVNRRDRPALEFIPPEIIEHEPLQLDTGEREAPTLDDESPSVREAPSLDDSPPEPAPFLPGTGVELDHESAAGTADARADREQSAS
jgi:hypothetical protein